MARALIVDPDEIAAEDMQGALLDIGIQGKHVSSAEEAMEELRETEYDMMCIESALPGLCGAELCGRVRAASMVPIIFHSIDGSDASKVAAFCAGADDYVTKPASAVEIRCRAKAVMRRAALQREVEPTRGRELEGPPKAVPAWG